jgi:ATP-dependent helicase/nuclease subunit A
MPADLDPLSRDRAARKAAQTLFDRPLVLQAGAGTGKTTTLVARLLAWSLGPGWEATAARLAERARGSATPNREQNEERVAAELLTRLVAITFTEAAATEMATRTAQELARLAATGTPPTWLAEAPLPAAEECARRAAALLGALDRLNVRTIHAFCRSLLADYALEAGLHPDLEVDAEGTLLEEIALEVVEDRLRTAYGDPGEPDFLTLATLGFGPREVAETLIELAAKGLPARALAVDPLAEGPLAALAHRLELRCRDLHSLLAPRLATAKKTVRNALALERGLAALLDRLAGGTAGFEEMRQAVDELLPEALVAHLRKWCREMGKTEAIYLGEVAAELARASARLADLLEHLVRVDPQVLQPAFRVLHPLLGAVEEALRTRGIATFDALLTGAEALLARRPQVRARVRRGIDQLLVDEFQDTDRTQCELLRWLSLDGPPEERPGLFLVGDPKQSVYGWRSADLRAYDGFVARVLASGGEVLPLVENFRSVPAILDEVSRVVEPVMHARAGFQPPFERLVPCADKGDKEGFRRAGRSDGSWSPVEYWLSWKESAEGGPEGSWGAKTTAAEATAIEAEAVAADLRALHDEHGVPWKETALLLRSTGDLDVYLEALRRQGVPFAVGRDKQYYRRREIIEIAAWVRAVVDPGDHLALVTVLRSSTVGVPDAALIPLWSRGFPRRLTELVGPDPAALAALREVVERAALELPRDVPGLDRIAGWHHNLTAAVEALAELRAAFASEPADRFVERLRLLTLVEATEAARYLGAYRLANLERFFRQLLDTLETSGGDTRALLRTLRRSVAESREAGEGRPQEAGGDAVSVLTFHGAKGLDFGHVYLLQLHHKDPARRTETSFGRVEPEGEEGSERFEIRLFGVPTLGFDEIDSERREVEANERVRTLYVGMTRAKERLVLTGSWPASIELVPVERAANHLDLLRGRAESMGGALRLWEGRLALPPEEEGRWRSEDETGAVWKLPALRRREQETEAQLERGGERAIGDAAREAAEAQLARELKARRTEACERMERRFRGTASEEAHPLLREAQTASWTADEEQGGAGGRAWIAEGAIAPAATEAAGVDGGPVPENPARETAMAAGGAFHRALETWDLEAEPDAEAARQLALLPSYLAALAAGGIQAAALEPAREMVEAFRRGPLLPRLLELKGSILARELPLVATPGDRPGAPVGAVVGTIDLLYRDAEGLLVVADYKTDRLADDEAVAERALAYAGQGAVYTRAIREALALEAEPRFELWFVRAGRVVEP